MIWISEGTIIVSVPYELGRVVLADKRDVGDEQQLTDDKSKLFCIDKSTLYSLTGTSRVHGVVHAGSGFLDGGIAQVVATTTSGVSRTVSIAVTGTQGGMVTVTRDLLNWADNTEFGPAYQSAVTIGNRAYVLCTNMPDMASIPGYEAYWIDTWDITDPLNPNWITATGVPVDNRSLVSLGDGLLVTSGWDAYTDTSIALVYDLQGGVPVLSNYSTTNVPALGSLTSINGHVGYSISGTQIVQWDLSALAPPQPLAIQLPSEYYSSLVGPAIAGNDRRLCLAFGMPATDPWQLSIYDLTVSPPALLNSWWCPKFGLIEFEAGISGRS